MASIRAMDRADETRVTTDAAGFRARCPSRATPALRNITLKDIDVTLKNPKVTIENVQGLTVENVKINGAPFSPEK